MCYFFFCRVVNHVERMLEKLRWNVIFNLVAFLSDSVKVKIMQENYILLYLNKEFNY